MNCPAPNCSFSTKSQTLLRIHIINAHSNKPKKGK